MTVGPTVRGLRILHLALLASIVMYAVILAIVVSQPAPKDWKPVEPMLLEVVLGPLVVAIQIGLAIYRKKRLPPTLDGAPIDDTRNLDMRESGAIDRLREVSILTWAMCESCAIFGLVLGFLTRDLVSFVPFAVVGFASMAWYRPSRALVEGVVRGANG